MKQRLRVLLVEDDPDDLLIARELLSQAFGAAADVEWTCNSDEALDAMIDDRHDVFVVDYQLGATSGLELLANARAMGTRTPTILLTGHDTSELDEAALRAGAADFLVKQEISAPLLRRAIRYAIERKKIENNLATLAHRDTLTGLANRALFQDRLQVGIAQRARGAGRLALLILDLDHFKEINDSLGHPCGDQLLRQAAERITQCARSTDTVARLGGDEFAVIASGLREPHDAAALAQKIHESFEAPFAIDGKSLLVTTSIGIAVCELGSDAPDTLLKAADIALYQAKASGRNAYRFFSASMNARVARRQQLSEELRIALADEEFRLHFQPKVSAASGAACGAEALLRWHRPGRLPAEPTEFIPIAERSGAILPLGAWVMANACRQAVAWANAGLPAIPIAVNLSAVQLRDTELVRFIETVLRETGLAPERLELEITESAIIDPVKPAKQALHDIRSLGVRIAIDDFGTGFSAFSYLRRFQVDALKIDRSFVKDMNADPVNAAITSAIITLGRELGLDVVAEGVETEDQVRALRALGCERMQGYHFSQALPAAEFAAWHARERLGAPPPFLCG